MNIPKWQLLDFRILKDGKRVADVFYAPGVDAEWTIRTAQNLVDTMNEIANGAVVMKVQAGAAVAAAHPECR